MTNSFATSQISFSFSSASTFERCPQAWFLTYILRRDSEDNFYSQFGRYIHLILEKYFKKELDTFTMSQFYEEHFDEHILVPQPPHVSHREFGKKFFDGIHLDRNDFDVVSIEPFIRVTDGKLSVVVKPDVVLKSKETGKTILLDYKTSNFHRKSGSIDFKKFDEYKKQLLLYAYYMKMANRPVDEIAVWSIRLDKLEKIVYNEEDLKFAHLWFLSIIRRIEVEKEWKTNPQEFFCQNLCGVRKFCPIYGD